MASSIHLCVYKHIQVSEQSHLSHGQEEACNNMKSEDHDNVGFRLDSTSSTNMKVNIEATSKEI
eukprot:m.380240 g.380240  ORF g.380240 m.380240 type:complete len:64 (-) comp103815_c0_seq1:35-226(-)